MNDLYSALTSNLKKLYGKFDEVNKRFEKSSNSEIARELGYSDAQFSRLINQSATTGEYQRAIQNVNRILQVIHLEGQLKKSGKGSPDWKTNPHWFYAAILLLVILVGVTVMMFSDTMTTHPDSEATGSRDAMLQWAFETSFINPYTRLDDLPEDCNYPCYKYQGKWELKNGYKIPFFRERNGFHYLATEVNMYARCMNEKDPEGNIVEGYEYQKHEIWYDKRELPIDSFTFKGSGLKAFYQDMDFSQDKNFVKVATVHTFFRNEFEIDSIEVHRKGKVIGRDLEFVPQEGLELNFTKEKVKEIESELTKIATNRLEDFSKPIACGSARVPSTDFHAVKDGDEMSYDCQLTTSRVSLNYTKTFVLTDQYIKNTCRAY